MSLLKHILDIWTQYRAFREIFSELSSRSDRELKDRGLSRSDIARVALEQAEQRAMSFAARRTRTHNGTGREPMTV